MTDREYNAMWATCAECVTATTPYGPLSDCPECKPDTQSPPQYWDDRKRLYGWLFGSQQKLNDEG